MRQERQQQQQQQQPPPCGRLLTTPEACEYLRVSEPTLYRLARRWKIKGVKYGRSRRWKQSELNLLVKYHTQTVK